MAATQVQKKGEGKADTAAQTQTITFDSPPTQGNMLICIGNIDDSFTVTMTSAGWTKVQQDGSGAPGNGGIASFIKIAGASEPSAVEMDYGELNRRGAMIIFEYSNDPALSLDQFAALYSAASFDKSSGTTPVLSSDAILGIAGMAHGNDNSDLAGTSWTNGFIGEIEAPIFLIDHMAAVADLDGSDVTLETTATHAAFQDGSAVLLVFKAAAAGDGLASFRDAVATDAAASDAAATDAVARDVGA